MTRALTIAASLGALAALAACGGTSTTSSGGGGTPGATISTGTANGMTVLTNSAGFTLYFLSTEQGADKCTAQAMCSTVWPAIAPPSSGAPVAGSGVTGTLSVINAADGTKEVAYNGWPLHTFQNDTAAGQAGGNNIMSFGGTWFTATPSLTASGAGTGGSTSPSASPSTTTPYGY
jgi:predicted lipoprotein with Yx(FWY)xxD motif